MKSSTYYFHVETKILADFQICISVPLSEVEIAIEKYGNHPSIIAITEKTEKLGNPTFSFDSTSYEETVKEVNNLKIRKVSQKTDIPVRIIQEDIDIVSHFLYHNSNNSLSCSTFATAIKYA